MVLPFLFILSFAFLAIHCSEDNFTVHPIKFVQSANDQRELCYLTLSNGLSALIVHDADTNKASASLDVHVGYFFDPEDVPGLAHFLEHLLSMGTKKYLDESEYDSFLDAHGGHRNAHTDMENTNYYFDVAAEYLEPTLDRLAQFFIEPLFDPSYTEREREAVHSEHQKDMGSDDWRIYQLQRHLSNPLHPYHKFGGGHRETLLTKKGEDIREILMKFYDQNYSPCRMKLVVYGCQSLDELTEWVTSKFSRIPERSSCSKPPWVSISPLLPEHDRKRVWTRSLKDFRALYLQWIVSDSQPVYSYQPLLYLSYLIGHQGEGSCLSYLKKQGWATSLSAESSERVTGFEVFQVSVQLTAKGLEHHEKVVALIFEYIDMLKKEGPQRRIYEEYRDLGQLDFNFMEKESPEDFCSKAARSLHYYEPKDILSGPYLIQFNQSLIQSAMEELSRERWRVFIIQNEKDPAYYNEIEPWYGTEYKVEDMKIVSPEKNQEPGRFHLPEKNDFIPRDLRLRGTKSPMPQTCPIQLHPPPPHLHSTTKPTMHPRGARMWHKLDDTFMLPKANIYLFLSAPVFAASPFNYVSALLWKMCFLDAINEKLYPIITMAGLSYELSIDLFGVEIKVSGFQDKLPQLLISILEEMLANRRVDSSRFHIMQDKLISYEDV